tara:strand:+ start:208 stop:1419 length:1212 start_codon:yes stop_codon:yes gene_type:complete
MGTKEKIAIIGLGYVGLPLAKSFSKYFETYGFDINKDFINKLKKENINNILFSFDYNEIKDANVFIITVPTPVTSDNKPDLSCLKSASEIVGKILKKNDTVIYESTVYPGVTEEFCVPILEKNSKLTYNKDFNCGYSPERINPGDRSKSLENIVKITSGSNKETSDFVDNLYKKIITAGTVSVSSIKIAEASKIVENIQRDVNIALMNEFAMIFDKLNLSTSEILKASKTKWNFLDFKPGLVGGHCIGIDPYYLIYKSIESGYIPDIILSSRKINNIVPSFVVNKVISQFRSLNKKISKSDILILGYTFKENCEDIRNTKVKEIVDGLIDLKCNVDVYDPLLQIDNIMTKNPFKNSKKYDIFILAVAHNIFYELTKNDFLKISKGNLVLLDLKNVYSFATWKF